MKRLADRRQRRARRIGFWVAVGAIVGYLFFVGDQRPHHLLLLWLEERRAEERIASLEAERRELAAEAERLSTDSLALEALAREKGMVRPGDLVYRIVPVPPDVREAAAESLAARAARRAADSLAAGREAEASPAARVRSPETREPPARVGPPARNDSGDPVAADSAGAGADRPPPDAGPAGEDGGFAPPDSPTSDRRAREPPG